MMKRKIFGHDILLKSRACNTIDIPGGPMDPMVNIFVKVTNGCNAHCLFCSNAGETHHGNSFNREKLIEIARELKRQDIRLNRISITGGEPSIVPDLVKGILEDFSTEEFQEIAFHLNTNGILSNSQELMRHPRWTTMSMSLHHYDLKKLSELYHTVLPQDTFDFTGIDMDKINVSCNLIRGYIDNATEAKKMLDFALELGVPCIGFVALMKVNEFCKDHYVDISDIKLDTIPHVYYTRSKDRGNDCKCSNYLYNHDLKILDIYMRNYMNPQYCESSMVYDGEFLRQGFGSDSIIF